jgi:hypothetical protein
LRAQAVPPAVFQLSASTYTVDASTGVATIGVVRSGSLAGTITVGYSTGGGSAVPGADYQPVNGRLVFEPGVSYKIFTVPIFNRTTAPGDRIVTIVLASPSPGGTLGAADAATLDIHVAGPPTPVNPPPPPTPVNPPPPLSIRSLALTSSRKGVKQLVIQLDGQVAASQAENLADYALVAAGNDRRFGTRDDRSIRIITTGFNPVNDQVTLTLAKPIKLTQPYRLTVLSDASGLPLSGGNYQAFFGRPPKTSPGKGKGVKGKSLAVAAIRTHAAGEVTTRTRTGSSSLALKVPGGLAPAAVDLVLGVISQDATWYETKKKNHPHG